MCFFQFFEKTEFFCKVNQKQKNKTWENSDFWKTAKKFCKVSQKQKIKRANLRKQQFLKKKKNAKFGDTNIFALINDKTCKILPKVLSIFIFINDNRCQLIFPIFDPLLTLIDFPWPPPPFRGQFLVRDHLYIT